MMKSAVKLDVDSVDQLEKCNSQRCTNMTLASWKRAVVNIGQLEKCSLSMSTKKSAAVNVDGTSQNQMPVENYSVVNVDHCSFLGGPEAALFITPVLKVYRFYCK